MQIECPICQSKNDASEAYCESCGSELSTTTSPQTPVAPVDNEPLTAPELVPASPTPPPPPQPSDPWESEGWEDDDGGDSPPEPEPSPTPSPAAPVNDSPLAAKLVFIRFGALSADHIPLHGQKVVIGKFDAEAGPVDIDLTGIQGQEYISKKHAELFWEAGSWRLRDLGSTNGSFHRPQGVDAYSARLQDVVLLGHGDEIALGNVRFQFQIGG